MAENFTAKQREIVARKLGYDGPMQGFDNFLNSSPALGMKYATLSDKFATRMAKGGMARRKKFQAGGLVESLPTNWTTFKPEEKISYFNEKGITSEQLTGAGVPQSDIDWMKTQGYTGGAAPVGTTGTTLAGQPGSDATVNAGSTGTGTTTGAVTSALPANWSTFTPAQKVSYFNTNRVNENQLKSEGVPQSDIDYMKSIGYTGAAAPAPAAPTTTGAVTSALPANWSTLTPAQKVSYFNTNRVNENQLKSEGVPQSDIDYMKSIGYNASPGGVTAGTTRPDTTVGAPAIPSAATITAEQTATPVGANTPVIGATTAATATKGATPTDVAAPTAITATDATAASSQAAIEAAQAGTTAATGTVSEGAKVTAATGEVSEGAKAAIQKVGAEFQAPVVAGKRDTVEGEMVTAVTDVPTIKAEAAQAAAPTAVQAAQGTVQANELVQAAQIAEKDMAQATAITAEGLAPDAKVVAARLEKFTVDDGTLAQAAQGNVDAQATVQGQLASLMKSFDDGATPAWAAGAIRAANAVMASRGLGGSSMAGVAVFQAAMESALPIASQDAQSFQQMGLANLNNRQQVAIANAAAQQGLSLANLNNEQQARLQNSTNSFALQSQNLSNMQQVMLANTQIRASLQGQNLNNQQQAAVVNAARYAEQANLNLNNIQQAALHNSSMQVQVDISNASNRQQAALANAQIEAAMQGKVLDNKQQAAVLNAARVGENANLTFTASQTAALHNSEMMKSIGIANLNAAQSTTIANAATFAAMDLANLNTRQQAAVENARAFLATDLKNLDNEQQIAVLKSQQIAQSILSDTAAENAASITNATNATDVAKLNATLANSVNQFNASEKNKVAMADTLAANELSKFNAEQANQRETFNANNATQINLANAKILAEVSTANTAAVNAANAINAKNATDLSAQAYAQQSQTYRDLLEMSWKTGESFEDRANTLATAVITSSATTNAAKTTADGKNIAILGNVALKFAESKTGTEMIDKAFKFLFGD